MDSREFRILPGGGDLETPLEPLQFGGWKILGRLEIGDQRDWRTGVRLGPYEDGTLAA